MNTNTHELPTFHAKLSAEHKQFRESFRRFLDATVVPNYGEYEQAGIVPREIYHAAGEAGFMGMNIPERYGGAGIDDFWFNAMLHEEIGRTGTYGFGAGLAVHNDVCPPYFMRHGNEGQCERWLPGIASGELLTAIAMTEPDTGSDLGAIVTRAELDGDEYVINGAKTFTTNGINADLIIVVVRTEHQPRHAGLSLLVVERDTPGFERGRNLAKIGMHSQDTAELYFNDARVPRENLLGEPGYGFGYVVGNLPRERLSIAVAGVAAAYGALDWTLSYVRQRHAFGQPLSKIAAVRLALADAFAETEVAGAFVERCIERLNEGELSAEEAALAKWWCTETQGRVIDTCLQLHGGYGYMLEYPIARAFVDARACRIYGGANEVMRELVARGLGL